MQQQDPDDHEAEDDARAGFYALLARLLRTSPDAGLLAMLVQAGPVSSDGELALEDAWLNLTRAAGEIDAAAATHEFARLFAGADGPAARLGALCEAMRAAIQGEGGAAAALHPLLAQKTLFDTRIRPWYAACLADLAHAEGARFYRAVAVMADAFLSIEAQAFAVLDAASLPPS